MRIIVIDDEKNSRELLSTLLTRYCDIREKDIESAHDVAAAIDQINKFRPSLIFLDIKLKGDTGFSVLEQFQNAPFLICFATGYEEYALKAANSHAFGYIIKPIDLEELKSLVARARIKLKDTLAEQNKEKQTIFINEAADSLIIEVDSITHILSERNYSIIHQVNDTKILSSKSLGYFEEILPNDLFYRSHRSYILNLSHIFSVKEGRTGIATMTNGHEIPIANRRTKQFWEKFDDLKE